MCALICCCYCSLWMCVCFDLLLLFFVNVCMFWSIVVAVLWNVCVLWPVVTVLCEYLCYCSLRMFVCFDLLLVFFSLNYEVHLSWGEKAAFFILLHIQVSCCLSPWQLHSAQQTCWIWFASDPDWLRNIGQKQAEWYLHTGLLPDWIHWSKTWYDQPEPN